MNSYLQANPLVRVVSFQFELEGLTPLKRVSTSWSGGAPLYIFDGRSLTSNIQKAKS